VEWAVASADEHNMEIVADIVSDLPKVYVDVDRIGQVFDNLIGNALKFSPPGSKINIGAEQEGDKVKFWVQDNGKGIPPDKLDKIFLRFYQINDTSAARYSGAGLGLTIVRQIIEAHKGEIRVESVVNEGTTFLFWLPADNYSDINLESGPQ
jgi:signal transduction histidine kinase